MLQNKFIDILNNLCNMFINDGQIPEEVIEMLVDAGADIGDIKEIGFSDEQIQDYAYYESSMSGKTEDEILQELKFNQKMLHNNK